MQSQIYIYNNIFFSFCVDIPNTFQETCHETVPTYTAANADLKGIQKVEKLDHDGLYTLATCIV